MVLVSKTHVFLATLHDIKSFQKRSFALLALYELRGFHGVSQCSVRVWPRACQSHKRNEEGGEVNSFSCPPES